MSTRKCLFVAIEGADGIGKTTLAKALAERLNGIYFKVPLRILKPLARFLDRFQDPEIETIGYTLLAIITSWWLKLYWMILRGRSVICDKYILTTIVDQTVLGGHLASRLAKWRYLLAVQPDLTICLIVSTEQALASRLSQRERLDANDICLRPLWQEIQAIYSQFSEVIIIDTTTLNVQQTLETAWQYFQQ